ncbi:unnamed protein product [Darwinula stevensoni]|uniref:Calx-beta domain-containing protein n=1 Tax=Darwinula stevensoni TaxID=69355 RepID=A0A7R8X844_9CRUS|nr:unnamed protein product [Darwinula stevensoni]CAG0887576.1 unnamed protein product [Darwinula stevensoni]
MSTINSRDLYNYECSDRGLLLPLISEYTWPKPVRAGLYFVALLYCFLGIAIIADIFMCAIEKITSKTRKVYLSSATDNQPEVIEVRVWNDTVANLTLMALGSSAPEILLSIIEIVGNKFEAGELGPGTIVGSAAFNLMCICAICIVAVPSPEARPIKAFKVFVVTAVWSLIAYLWLLVILVGITPNVVDLWEAIVTFLFFPILVIMAYVTDIERWGLKFKGADKKKQIELGNFQPGESSQKQLRDEYFFRDGKVDKDSLVQFVREVKKYPGLSEEDAALLAATKLVESQPHSRLWYRIGATRQLAGSRKTKPQVSEKLQEVSAWEKLRRAKKAALASTLKTTVPPPKTTTTTTTSKKTDKETKMKGGKRSYPADHGDHLANMPAVENIKLPEIASPMSSTGTDWTKIIASAAIKRQVEEAMDKVYDAMNEHPDAPTLGKPLVPDSQKNAVFDFEAATVAVMENVGKVKIPIQRTGRLDKVAKIRVETIDGSAEAGQDYVKIQEVLEFEPNETEKMIEVEILNDEQWEPDEEFFLKLNLVSGEEDGVELGRINVLEITILNDDNPGTLMFKKRGMLVQESVGTLQIPVIRKDGADGDVSVSWKTHDKSAVEGKDYIGKEGTITFKSTEVEKLIEIEIKNDFVPEKNEHFEVELLNPVGGARVGKINRVTVTITNDDDFNSIMNRMLLMTNANMDKFQVHTESWGDQFKEALSVNGGDTENATFSDCIMHVLTFGWKLIFAFVPPPSILGGWLAFSVSLIFIGIITAIVGDLAAIFGCLVGLKDAVTAITFVALGTSLPDTFASKTAAVQEKYADNAVGNVTGSNSVNVFLGLGLPWLIAAIYHATKGQKFKVSAGNMGFSVTVFTVCAVLTLGLLVLRRYLGIFGKGELGGPKVTKYASAFFLLFLWLAYILLSSLQIYGRINTF